MLDRARTGRVGRWAAIGHTAWPPTEGEHDIELAQEMRSIVGFDLQSLVDLSASP